MLAALSDHDLEDEIRRQFMLFSFSQGKSEDPKKIQDTSPHTIFPLLPTAHKISALFSISKKMKLSPIFFENLGFEKRPLQATPLKTLAEESERFCEDVEGLTSGVLSSFHLDHSRTLQMLLFGELERCQTEGVHKVLEEFFLFFNAYIHEINGPTLLEEAAALAQTSLRLASPSPSLSKVIQIFSLFEKSVKDPFLYFPRLLRPLEKRKITFNLLHVEEAHPCIKNWLSDFQRACQLETSALLKVKKTRTLSEQYLRLGTDLTEHVCAAVTSLESLLSLSAKDRFHKECQKFQQTLERLKAERAVYIETYNSCVRGFSPASVLWTFSFTQHSELVYDTLKALHMTALRERLHRQGIELLIPPRFREIREVMLVDLFRMEISHFFANQFATIAIEPEERIELLQFRTDFLIILIFMQGYYQSRKHRKRFNSPESVTYAKRAFTLHAKIESFRARVKNQELRVSLSYIELFTNLLNRALMTERWPQIFEQSPFAKNGREELETAFNFELFCDMRGGFLGGENGFFSSLESMLSEITLEAEKPFVDLIKKMRDVCESQIAKTRSRIKRRATPTLQNFKAEANHFIETLSDYFKKIEEKSEDVTLSLAEYFETQEKPSDALKRVYTYLAAIGEFRKLFFSMGQPLIAFLNVSNLLEEEKQRQDPKLKTVQALAISAPAIKPTSSPPQIAPPTAAATPAPSLGTFEELKKLCRALHFYCNSFTPVGEGNEAHQQEHMNNLSDSLQALEEIESALTKEGDSPSVFAIFYLKLAVALEQSAKLATALCHIPVPSIDEGYAYLETRGHESLWKDHAPYVFTDLLQKAGKLELRQDQKKLLLDVEKVVSVSSRYPASGRDTLSRHLETLFQLNHLPPDQIERMRQLRCSQAEKMLQTGLEISLQILQGALDKSLQEAPPEHFHPVTLTPIKETISRKHWGPALESFKNRVNKIQTLHLIPGNSEVPNMESLNGAEEKRKGTIRISLRDIESNLLLLEDSLLRSSPATPRMTAEAIFLRQAVILERLLLIPLAHLPCRSGDSHYLWDYEGSTLRRNSHALEKFVEKLSEELELKPELLLKMRQLAKRFGLYLRVHYRYNGEGILDPFKKASQLRNREELKKQIEQLLEAEAIQPCREFLEIAEEWLKVYEKLLN